MTEQDIQIGVPYKFKNSLGEITESTVIAIGEPRKWMLTFQKPNGKTHDITIQAFLRGWKLYGVKEDEPDTAPANAG